MTSYDTYVFFSCLFVFIALTSLFSVFIVSIIKLDLKLIRNGVEDEEIVKEKQEESKQNKIIDKIVSFIVEGILIVLLVGILLINLGQFTCFKNMPTMSAVKSTSMEEKNKNNKYLFDNNLNDQVKMFDLVFTYCIPKEEDLKLYDIIVYEYDHKQIMHRIVKIEEPNKNHPNERWYTTQGDAVGNPDQFVVKYSQMKAIYRGESIPNIGSFVMFMQSPAGWLCILLVIFALFISPVVEKKITNEKNKRLKLLGYLDGDNHEK